MAGRTAAPPSPASGARGPRRRPARRRAEAPRAVDIRGWLGGIRLSAFTVIMLGLVVLATFVLVPTVGTYLDQRQQIAALQESVRLDRDAVAELERERDRWAGAAYITTQARERLYYHLPGEVVYLVADDLPASLRPQEQAPVSDEVQRTRTEWMSQFVRSIAEAGLAQSAVPSG